MQDACAVADVDDYPSFKKVHECCTNVSKGRNIKETVVGLPKVRRARGNPWWHRSTARTDLLLLLLQQRHVGTLGRLGKLFIYQSLGPP